MQSTKGDITKGPLFVVLYEKLQKLTIFRARPGKNGQFFSFRTDAPQGAKILQFPPSDSLTDTLKRTKFLPTLELGGDMSPRSPPTGRPW